MNKFKSSILFVLILTLSSLWAQDEINHNVVVMKSYSPVIGDANKLSEVPQIVDTNEVNIDIKYRIQSIPFYPKFTPQPIQPIKMIGEPLSKLYHNYVLLGFGNYTKPMFEYRYATTRSKELLAGVNLTHLSQHGNLKLDNVDDKVYSGYSRNSANIFLHRIFKHSALETDLTYRRHALHYYGYNASIDTVMEKEDNKQMFSWMNATMRYKTTRLDSSRINYDVVMDYNYFEDYYETFQNDFTLAGDFSLFFNKELIALKAKYQHFNILTPSYLYSNSIYQFQPSISKSNSHWGINAGLNIVVDASNDTSAFHFYPQIDLHYAVIDYFLVPYLGISGGVKSNNYKAIALENQFIRPGLHTRNSNTLIDLHGGIRGNFTDNLSYNIFGNYRVIDDAYFFVNDSLNPIENQFIVEYDDIIRYDIKAQISYLRSKKLQFSLLGQYHGFELDEIEHAWHVPDYEVRFSTNYNLKSKILVDFDMFVKGQRYAKTYYSEGVYTGAQGVKIAETFDISLGLEYRYTKMLSAFLRFNNILAHRNYDWNYYPTEGFNMAFGIIYSF
ncbi:MAG: hypothetical protein JXR60_01815 [Bacteroidales bacterium]|nr:hypothetical protein [Bacteroidales bacterium]